MTEFIRKEFHVDEADKTTVIRQGAPAPKPQMPGDGILYLIGLSGSGKSSLAKALAEKLGRPCFDLPLEGAETALEDIVRAGQGVAAVPHKLLASEALRQRMMATGRVLYLMADVEAIAPRLSADPAEQNKIRERLGRQRTAFEPWFMQTLHMLVPADGPLDAVLADALERLRW